MVHAKNLFDFFQFFQFEIIMVNYGKTIIPT